MNVDRVVGRKIKRPPVDRNSTNQISEYHYTFLPDRVFGATPKPMEAVALFGGQAPPWGGLVMSGITVFGMWTAWTSQVLMGLHPYLCLQNPSPTFI